MDQIFEEASKLLFTVIIDLRSKTNTTMFAEMAVKLLRVKLNLYLNYLRHVTGDPL